MTLERFRSEQATRSTVPTRVHTTDRRPLVLTLGYVLTGDRRRGQVDRESADTQLRKNRNIRKHQKALMEFKPPPRTLLYCAALNCV